MCLIFSVLDDVKIKINSHIFKVKTLRNSRFASCANIWVQCFVKVHSFLQLCLRFFSNYETEIRKIHVNKGIVLSSLDYVGI